MRKYPIAICLVFVIFYSCTSPRYIYAPSPPNDPHFREKGESKIAAYYSGGIARGSGTDVKSYNHGYDLQGAYAITKGWALTAGYFSRREQDVFGSGNVNFFDSSVVNYKRNIKDIGGGYFTPLGAGGVGWFACYGGVGFGKFSILDKGVDAQESPYVRFHHLDITKLYIQPSFDFFAGDYFSAAFIGKLSFIHYGKASTSYTTEEKDYFNLSRVEKKWFTYFEPTFNMRMVIPGCEWLSAEGALTFSSKPFSEDLRVDARSFNASIGLSFDLIKLRKNKKASL